MAKFEVSIWLGSGKISKEVIESTKKVILSKLKEFFSDVSVKHIEKQPEDSHENKAYNIEEHW